MKLIISLFLVSQSVIAYDFKHVDHSKFIGMKWKLVLPIENFNLDTYEVSVPIYNDTDGKEIVGYLKNKKSYLGNSYSDYVKNIKKKYHDGNKKKFEYDRIMRRIYGVYKYENGFVNIDKHTKYEKMEVVGKDGKIIKEGKDIILGPSEHLLSDYRSQYMIFFEKTVTNKKGVWYKILSPNNKFVGWINSVKPAGHHYPPYSYLAVDSKDPETEAVLKRHKLKTADKLVYYLKPIKFNKKDVSYSVAYSLDCASYKVGGIEPRKLSRSDKELFKFSLDEVLSTKNSRVIASESVDEDSFHGDERQGLFSNLSNHMCDRLYHWRRDKSKKKPQ